MSKQAEAERGTERQIGCKSTQRDVDVDLQLCFGGRGEGSGTHAFSSPTMGLLLKPGEFKFVDEGLEIGRLHV